jgi:hypothetical protein
MHYLVEEFPLDVLTFREKRSLAEFVTAVEKLYYYVEELKSKIAKCSYLYTHPVDDAYVQASALKTCEMAIVDRYMNVKRALADVNAFNIDNIIERILESIRRATLPPT